MNIIINNIIINSSWPGVTQSCPSVVHLLRNRPMYMYLRLTLHTYLGLDLESKQG